MSFQKLLLFGDNVSSLIHQPDFFKQIILAGGDVKAGDLEMIAEIEVFSNLEYCRLVIS